MFSKKNLCLFLIIILTILVTPNVLAYRGLNYDEVQNPDGTFTRTLQTNTYIQASNGTFVPYILSQTTNDIIVETNEGSFDFNKNTCTLSFYNGGKISGQQPTVGYDAYTVKAELNGTTNWFSVNTINNSSCIPSIITNGKNISVIGTKSASGIGSFSINYTKIIGLELKTTASATNNNIAWTSYHVGLTQTIQIPRFVTLGNSTFDISQHNGTVLNRAWISSHSAQLIQLSNKIHFNIGLGWNNVEQITIYWINNQASIAIDYTKNTPILQPNHTISIDPTFGFNPALTVYQVNISPTPAQATCPTTGFVKIASSNDLQLPASANGGAFCILDVPKFNTTGLHAYKITQTIFQYKINAGGSGMINCDYNDISSNHDPAIVNAQTLWNDANDTANGTSYVSNDSTCTTTGTKNQTLGNTANNDALNSISRGWFAIGWTYHQKLRDASLHDTVPDGASYKIQLTYSALNPPILLKSNTLSPTSINSTWGNATGATLFMVKRASPNGGAFVQIANTTNRFYVDTGLAKGTQYQYEIFAINGTNISIASNTKSNYTTNIAPTALSANLLSHLTTASINWTNPTGNVSGFKIEEQPQGSSWIVIISNTLNATNHYILTALTPAKNYGIRISTNYATGSNYSGTSSPSSILNFTAYQKSNGTSIINKTQVGNIAGLSVSTHLNTGYPTVIIKAVTIFNFTQMLLNATENQNITSGQTVIFPNILNVTLSTTAQSNFTATEKITNSSGIPIKIGPNNFVLAQGSYTPNSGGAVDYNGLPVNYTVSRTHNFQAINVTVIRDPSLVPWLLNLRIASSANGPLQSQNATWHNYTGNWFLKQGYNVQAPTTYYLDAYNPNNLVFSVTSYGQGNLTATNAIQIFQGFLGNFFGLPLGIAIILCVAGIFTAKNSDTGIIFVLVTIGILGSAGMGLITIGQTQWGVALFIGVIGILMGTRFRG